MFTTAYGSYDGTSWETMMQIIFKKKYQAQKYQRVPATPGDFGIEGFTRDGDTFQCYCPDVNSDNKTIYEKQRQKITDDINKLQIYAKDLEKILGDIKLRSWILVTPRMGHNDLLGHCHTKRELVKSWNLPFIDNTNFDILVHEIEDYLGEIGDHIEQTKKKFSISPQTVKMDRIIKWKDKQIDLINNALDKNEIRLKSKSGTAPSQERVNELTDETAKHYLNGESILKRWQNSQPENHQRFMELLASVEDELKEKIMLNSDDPNYFVKQVTDYMEQRIKSSFEYLDDSTVIRLKNYAVAAWLLRCPLYFEVSKDE